eukprot:scaffold45430_cov58-Attheya_sp.AAC.4
MLCGGAEHAVGVDCKGEKEDSICITVMDNVRDLEVENLGGGWGRQGLGGSIGRGGSSGDEELARCSETGGIMSDVCWVIGWKVWEKAFGFDANVMWGAD